MSRNMKWTIGILAVSALVALAAALASLWLLGGEDASDARTDPYNTPYSRVKDPAYIEALDRQRAKEKEIMRRIAKTREEIAALGDATNGEEYAALRRRLEAEAAEIEKNRIVSQTIVRDRIARENAAVKARQEKESKKQKGKDK